MNDKKLLAPSSFFCHFCSLYTGEEEEAVYLLWDEVEEMVVPCCEKHKDVISKEKFYSIFSLN